MKPSVKLFRYLAALAPLTLGVALSGCGGLLGAVEGEGPATLPVAPSRLTPAPTAVVLPASFTVNGTCGSLATLTSARVLWVVPGAAGAAPVQTVLANATVTGLSFTAPVTLTATQQANFVRGGLWVVEIVGTTNTGAAKAFAVTFIPPASAGGVVTVDCSDAATVATGLLLQQVAAQPTVTLTREFATVIAGLTATAARFGFTPAGGNAIALLTSIQGQNLASQVASVTMDPKSALLFLGESTLFTATATLTNGQSVAFPMTFTVSPANGVVTTVPIGGNVIWVGANAVGNTNITATAVGTTRSTTATVTVQLHPQGHAQGGGSGS